eukprot:sb/3467477/
MSHLDEIRNKIHLDVFTVRNTEDTRYPGTYTGYDDSWDFNKFRNNFKIQIIRREDREIEFDMIGVDTPFANAFRRILISEVPTMAIEEVFLYNNTSVIQDEVLCHRLGLLPINIDPRLFEMKGEGDAVDAKNTLQFKLKMRCGVKFCHDDILINVLRPGQEIDMTMHAVKGIGSDHAKFSPVATATYRLLPEIQLLKEFRGSAAEKLKSCFSPGVIEIENGVAVVKNARLDSGSREVLRHPELAEGVKLLKLRDHFIFTIESTGAVDPLELLREAVKVLKGKCEVYRKELDVLTT